MENWTDWRDNDINIYACIIYFRRGNVFDLGTVYRQTYFGACPKKEQLRLISWTVCSPEISKVRNDMQVRPFHLHGRKLCFNLP